jgi:hypothetical protein
VTIYYNGKLKTLFYLSNELDKTSFNSNIYF